MLRKRAMQDSNSPRVESDDWPGEAASAISSSCDGAPAPDRGLVRAGCHSVTAPPDRAAAAGEIISAIVEWRDTGNVNKLKEALARIAANL